METKCIVMGEDGKEKELIPIELCQSLSETVVNPSFDKPDTNANEWDNLELISKAASGNYYDIIFAYQEKRQFGALYLGLWNDGVVEEKKKK